MVDNSAKHFRFRSFYLFCQDFDDVEVTRVSMQAFLSFSKPLERTVTDTTTIKIGSRRLHVATSVGRKKKKQRERKETAMESNLLFGLLTN